MVPVALTRLSRGGKTRSLHELALEFRKRDASFAIISVRFNSQTPLLYRERDKPLQALCRRIAFAAVKGKYENEMGEAGLFEKFLHTYDVTSNSVVD